VGNHADRGTQKKVIKDRPANGKWRGGFKARRKDTGGKIADMRRVLPGIAHPPTGRKRGCGAPAEERMSENAAFGSVLKGKGGKPKRQSSTASER